MTWDRVPTASFPPGDFSRLSLSHTEQISLHSEPPAQTQSGFISGSANPPRVSPSTSAFSLLVLPDMVKKKRKKKVREMQNKGRPKGTLAKQSNSFLSKLPLTQSFLLKKGNNWFQQLQLSRIVF